LDVEMENGEIVNNINLAIPLGEEKLKVREE
jgi:hypothetical protein